jgi:hypothetical protein
MNCGFPTPRTNTATEGAPLRNGAPEGMGWIEDYWEAKESPETPVLPSGVSV